MNYRNTQIKLDELMGYFRNEKINLIPPFQRGRVWSTSLRKKLLENMVRGKPIPAIFLYKEEAGSMYSYNILDGKQRLESILLFVADARPDFSVSNWRHYFFRADPAANFAINVSEAGERTKNRTFAELDDALVRDFREYSIPAIEINLDTEEGGLQEIIDLFIDINQLGVKVNRFDIVRTMYEKNKLLSGVFKLVGQKQKRKGDTFYKMVNTDFTKVIKKLQAIDSLPVTRYQQRVDRAWERLLEIVLFVRTGQHRTLAQILRAFIGSSVDESRITSEEMAQLRKTFKFLRELYSRPSVKTSKLVADQPHFYTMVTSIHAVDLIDHFGAMELKSRLERLAQIVDGKDKAPKGKAKVLKEYLALSSKQTTHPGTRKARQELFVELVEAIQ